MPGTSAIGGINVYPALEDIAQLFRSSINDDMAGLSGTPGQGQIATDAAPFMIPYMNAAIEELYSDLRIVGDPEFIYDSYVVTNLPVVNGPYGIGQVAPETQVYLGINGYFDGTIMYPNLTLPIYTRNVLMVWERASQSAANFTPMVNSPYLNPYAQTESMGYWEYRQGAIWMPGAVQPVDIRIRGTIAFQDFVGNSTNINFPTTYVPVVDSKRAIVYNMLMRYADRFAPEQSAAMEARYDKAVLKLRMELVRRKQAVSVARDEFAGIESSFGLASQL